MSRPERITRKRFDVFCEGDTEYNYINTMRANQGVEIALNPIEMHGGGYSAFLEAIKSKGQSNCIAKFIIVDGDRIPKNSGELANFMNLFEFCKTENEKKGYTLLPNSKQSEF